MKDVCIQEKKRQNFNFEDVMHLNKKEAIARFGKPDETFTDVLDNMQGEFYLGIQAVYKDRNPAFESIHIEQLTWTKDSLNNITVWYENLEDTHSQKDILIWAKGSEF